MPVRKNSLSYYILLSLEKAVDGYVRFQDFTYHYYRYHYGIPVLDKSHLAQALKRLRERGLVREEKINTGEIILKLTDQGKDIFSVDNWTEENWDGKWRIVIWDIPEQRRVIRNLFRRNLKKWGFKHLQKSVWVSKMDIYNKLEGYIKELGIENWVTVLEANKISGYHNR